MTASKALFGLRPSSRRGGASNSVAQNQYRIANGLAQNLFRGDPVKVTLGYIQRCSATTDFAIGVFQGAEYTDPTTKRPTWTNQWTSGTSVTDGSQPVAMVNDDANAVVKIQADASVSVGDIGLNFDVTIGAGNATTGASGYGLKASTRKTTTALLRVRDIYAQPDNAFSDAFPILECIWVQHADYRTSGGASG